MKVIICIDDRNGMLFHNRRQSQDKTLREYLLKKCEGKKLWMNSYSGKQFKDHPDLIEISEDFLRIAGEDDICFVEDQNLKPYLSKIDQFTVIHWNRHYPADLYFEISLPDEGFHCTGIEEFQGNSHEKITAEEYTR